MQIPTRRVSRRSLPSSVPYVSPFLACLRLLCLSLLFVGSAAAQTVQTWDDFEDLVELNEDYQVSDDDALYSLYRQPLNLNQADSLALSAISFLSPEQVGDILSYRRRCGQFLSLGELAFISSLSRFQLTCLPLFVYCGEPPASARSHTLKQEAALYGSYPFYTRQGYTDPDYDYPGNKLSHTLRYRLYLDHTWTAGFNLHKDDGESNPFDEAKFYAMYSSTGFLRQAIVGCFQAQFGQGLVTGNSNSTTPLSILTTYRPVATAFRLHTATSESQMLRGGALTLQYGSFSLRLFGSYTSLDARVSDGLVQTVYTTGYHRTSSERGYEGNLHLTAGGANLLFHTGQTNLSLSFLGGHYSIPLRHYTDYRAYRMHGSDFFNASVAYNSTFGRFSVDGEAATSSFGGVALTNTLKFRPSYGYVFMLQHRLLTCRYVAPLANTHTLASQPQDEHALLLAAGVEINERHSFTAYVDAAYHEKPTYYCFGASTQAKAQLQYSFRLSESTDLSLRYQFTLQQRDLSDELLKRHQQKHTLRLQASYPLWRLTLTTAAHLSYFRSNEAESSWGKMLTQRITYKRPSFSLSLYGALFDVDSYDARLYSSAPRLTYITGSSLRYGRGFALSACSEYKFSRILSLGARFEVTYYTDRDYISSLDRLINHSTKSDLSLQLKFSL